MTEIRVERKDRGKPWLWIVIAIVVLIAAAIVMGRLGYVDLPIGMSGP